MQLGRLLLQVGRVALFILFAFRYDAGSLWKGANSMNAITVEHLRKKYKEHVAVDDISFQVKEGELFAFLGENGAGKSTTINILCTILKKTSGEVKIFDYELGKNDDDIRNSIGIVFHS